MDTKKEYGVNIKKDFINNLDTSLLTILLKDRSSGKNIIWATDTYNSYGNGFGSEDYILPNLIMGNKGCIIKPRIEKSKREQEQRIKNKAEVFTPSWVCNKQNNLVDSAWFGRENVFNIENDKYWTPTVEKIVFSTDLGKTWQDYVKANRLEISCGEAPYLTSRYDSVTGQCIDIKNRIGLLDRKLRVVSENVNSEQDWYNWTLIAYQSTYGFDWQGDNVFIARENLLLTFIDAYMTKFNILPTNDYLKEVAKIISWNIWQMDGLKYVIPNSCKLHKITHYSLFEEEIEYKACSGCQKNDLHKHNGIYCQIMDWEKKKRVKFISLIGR